MGSNLFCEILKDQVLEREQNCKAEIIAAAIAEKIVMNFPQPPIGKFCDTARGLGLKVE